MASPWSIYSARLTHAKVVERSGASGGTVSLIRQELKRSLALYRNTESHGCVPIACQSDETDEHLDAQAFEKIGGPGRIRTCDNAVMSGGF